MVDAIFYRPHMSELASDGTLSMRASIWDDESHSSVVVEVRPTAEDYLFWRWVVMQRRYAKVLDERAVADARVEYVRFCEWRNGIISATPDA